MSYYKELNGLIKDINMDIDQRDSEASVRKYILKRTDLRPNTKLVYLYLLENEIDTFNGGLLNRELGIGKAHWLRYVQPELEDLGFIRQIDRINYEFLNATKINLY